MRKRKSVGKWTKLSKSFDGKFERYKTKIVRPKTAFNTTTITKASLNNTFQNNTIKNLSMQLNVILIL